MSVRLLVADPHLVVRAGLRSYLAGTEIKIVAEAANGDEAIELLLQHDPDVVLLAVDGFDKNGLVTLAQMKQTRPAIPVLMLACYDYPSYLAHAHRTGASGFLRKDCSRARLLGTIRAAAADEKAWTREEIRRVTGVLTTSRLDADVDVPLTQRESEVLHHLTSGLTNRKIAELLGISYETVKEHVQHILRKIGVEDRTQAAVWAVRKGLA